MPCYLLMASANKTKCAQPFIVAYQSCFSHSLLKKPQKNHIECFIFWINNTICEADPHNKWAEDFIWQKESIFY